MSARVERKNPNWLADLMRRYRNDSVLAVGYPASEAGGIKYPDGTPVILVAAVNNYGSQSRGIPARPFMEEGSKAAIDGDAGKVAAELIPLLNSGKLDVPEILKQMGPFAEASFKEVFTGVSWEPNAPATVEEKGSAQPLIDTSLLRNSLTHVVRKG